VTAELTAAVTSIPGDEAPKAASRIELISIPDDEAADDKRELSDEADVLIIDAFSSAQLRDLLGPVPDAQAARQYRHFREQIPVAGKKGAAAPKLTPPRVGYGSGGSDYCTSFRTFC
jgi:hypothetical protein